MHSIKFIESQQYQFWFHPLIFWNLCFKLWMFMTDNKKRMFQSKWDCNFESKAQNLDSLSKIESFIEEFSEKYPYSVHRNLKSNVSQQFQFIIHIFQLKKLWDHRNKSIQFQTMPQGRVWPDLFKCQLSFTAVVSINRIKKVSKRYQFFKSSFEHLARRYGGWDGWQKEKVNLKTKPHHFEIIALFVILSSWHLNWSSNVYKRKGKNFFLVFYHNWLYIFNFQANWCLFKEDHDDFSSWKYEFLCNQIKFTFLFESRFVWTKFSSSYDFFFNFLCYAYLATFGL